MARNFLTPIDLNKLELRNARIQNLSSDPSTPVAGQIYYNTSDSQIKYYNGGASAWQVIGQSVEQLEDAVADLLASGNGISLDYNDETGTLTIANTGVTSVTGTANEVSVSASAGAVTLSLPDTIYVDVQGTAASATYAVTAGTANSVAADSVALGTDTTGDYVAGATAGTGISIDGSGGEGSSLTISNTGVTSVSGTANEVTVSASAGAVTIGLPDDVTIGGNLTVTGDLTVSGSTTYLNTATLQVEDNKVVLNSNATGAPTVDAGIEIERGDAPNAELFWDESEGRWTASNGSASYITALKYSENVGDGVETSFVITHGLNSRDAIVNVYDNSTYETVEVDVTRTNTNAVTISFAIAPSNNAYRVVVVA
jgi:hypothetical protein